MLWPRVRRPNRQMVWRLGLVLSQLLLISGTAWVLWPLRGASSRHLPDWPSYTPQAPDRQETIVLTLPSLAPGTTGSARVIVRDPGRGLPLPGADVRVSLGPSGRPADWHLLYEGLSDAQGTVPVAFPVPTFAGPEWDLAVDVDGPVGSQRVVRPIAEHRELRLELATDRSVYQPGQTIHLWSRALDGASLRPLPEQPVAWTVTDPRGNLVCVGKAITSAYGVVHAACRLAEPILEGAYRVSAALDGVAFLEGTSNVRESSMAHAILVESSAAPRYLLELETDREYAVAGQQVAATFRASYPWGQPLVGAQVRAWGELVRETARELEGSHGETDAGGVYRFAVDVDDGFAPGDDASLGELRLVVQIADDEGYTQGTEMWLPVASQPLLIRAEAESGTLQPGIENLIHVHTAYPDGQPAACTLTVSGPGLHEPLRTETTADGRGQFLLLPPDKAESVSLEIAAQDGSGRQGQVIIEVGVETGARHLLLRPKRSTYLPGETVHVDLSLVTIDELLVPPAVYLDVIRQGQMVAAHSAPMKVGQATLDVPLANQWTGPLALRAYVLLADGSLVTDARQIVIASQDALTVTVRPDEAQIAPGDRARVSIDVTGPGTRGVQSALAISMLPAHVLARGDRPADPVLSALQTQGDTVPASAEWDEWTLARSGVLRRARPVPDYVRQQVEAVASLRAAHRQAFTVLALRLIRAWVVAGGLMFLSALGEAWIAHTREQGRAGGLAGSAFGALIALPLLLGSAALLAYGGNKLFGPGAVLVLGLAWLAVLLAWLVYARREGSGWAYVLWISTLCTLALGVGLRSTFAQGAELPQTWIVAGWSTLAAAALAACLLALVLARRGARSGARTTWMLVLTIWVTFAGSILAGVPRQPSRPTFPQPVVEEESAPPLPVEAGSSLPDDLSTVGARSSRPKASSPRPYDPPAVGAGLSRPHDDETIYWEPHLLTDDRGHLTVEIPSPEKGLGSAGWLVAVRAWGMQGEAGIGQATLSVSRPLWIEASLPSQLTLGDELDLPVRVYNSLPLSQTIQLTVTQASWFNTRARGARAQEIEVAGHDVGLISVPIRVREWGRQTLEIVASGQGGSDAIAQAVDVTPGGLRVWRVFNGVLDATLQEPPLDQDALALALGYPDLSLPVVEPDPEPLPETRYRFRVPWSAVQGSERVTVTLYPHWESMLVEALEAMRSPVSPADDSSFNSLVAAIRTNALLHTYLQGGGSLPSMESASAIEARSAFGLNEQRLLAFESVDGGFGASREALPDVYHTAEALNCLVELAPVIAVDEALIERTAQWLMDRQSPEGTWTPAYIPPSWQSLPRVELPGTAYVAWSLIEAGYGDDPEVRLAVQHLARYPDKAHDPYVLALVANALLAYTQAQPEPSLEEALEEVLARLAERAEVGKGTATWYGEIETLSGAVGDAADVERVALAVYALQRAGSHSSLAAQGLAWLAARRDGPGLWGSPSTDWLAARALLAALSTKPPFVESTVYVSAAESDVQAMDVRSGKGGAAPRIAFDDLAKGYNDILLSAEGMGRVPYRVVGTYVLPWDQIELSLPAQEAISITVGYDRTELAVGEMITATVDVMSHRSDVVSLAVLELGLPPGLEPIECEWQSMAERGVIARYRRDEERMLVQLADLSPGEPVRFTYRLWARFPLSVRTLPARVYDAANPGRATVWEPIEITVLAEQPD